MRTRRWLAVPLLLALALVLRGSGDAFYAGSGGTAARAAVPAATLLPPSCTGAHDLRVDHATRGLQGVNTFDRVCVENGAVLLASGLSLRAGELYVDASSSIRDDGEDGPLPNGDHSGTAGGTITIAARQVILLGTISASGGAGLDGGDGFGGGDGGAGGTITLLAGNLDLAGKISADGGGGGMNGMCTANAGPDCSNPIPGNGGNGGTVTVQLLPPLNQGLRRQITALPGSGGFNSIAKNGQDGIAGTVVLSALSAAQGADLPPAPTSAAGILPTAPVSAPTGHAAGTPSPLVPQPAAAGASSLCSPHCAAQTTADRVYGQPNMTRYAPGASTTRVDEPCGVAVDGNGDLYVADNGNNRVLYFPRGSTTASEVYGQQDMSSSHSGTSATRLNQPCGVAVDGNGGLYVADTGNNRVLYFPKGSSAASVVYGQPDMTSTDSSTSATSLDGPYGVAVDGNGGLYVADTGNDRVLYFPRGSTTASVVYGQSDMSSGGFDISATGLRNPRGVAVDGSGDLYVADYDNDRVLYYARGSTTASAVYGEPNMSTDDKSTSATGLAGPTGVAVDGSGGLYVADSYNNRVLYYAHGSTTASVVYGQPDMTTMAHSASATSLNNVTGVAVDGADGLYVADSDNNRVLHFPAVSRTLLPTNAVPAPAPGTPGVIYVAATHHTIAGPFLTFYNTYGSVRIFGLPLTQPFLDHGQTVQYFERAELVLGAGKVHPAALGSQLTAGRHFPAGTPAANTATRLYFPATRHQLAGKFLRFWQTHHGSTVLGLPISEPLREQNGDGTGRNYVVQYFQDGRLEYHPELAGTGSEVSLGLLGRQVLHQRGWI